MFRFQYEGKTYAVSFQHNRNDPTMKFKGATACRLRVAESDQSWSELTMGAAHCSAHDNWNKSTGRKVALARVLEVHPRGFRTLVWNCYHLMSNQWGHISPGWHQPASQALNGAGTALPERPKKQELVLPPLV